MNKVLVTGSEGYIGSKLVDRLEDLNVRNVRIDKVDKKMGLDICDIDIENRGYDFIFHLAGQSGVPESVDDPIEDARSNIMGTLNIIRLANENNARLIFTTTGAAKGEPESPYGVSNRACEEYIKLLCNDCVILRLSSVYGDKPKGVVDNFIREEKCVIYGDGEAQRDFVCVDDVVDAIIKSCKVERGSYEIGSGKGVKVKDIAEATGKKIEYKPTRKGDKKRVVLNNELPGWEPRVDVINYVKDKCGMLIS